MKIIFLLVVVLASLSSCSQRMPASKVPSVVQNTLRSQFSNALDVEWEWEKKAQLFEAEFYLDSLEYTAHINTDGRLIMHKVDIPVSQLPAAVAATISREYGEYEIDEVEKLIKEGVIYYMVEIDKKADKDKKLIFSVDGKIANNVTYLK